MLSKETIELAYRLTKARIGRLAPDEDHALLAKMYVDSAVGELKKDGFNLTDEANDLSLVVDLAVHKYNRRDKNEPMNQSLKWDKQDRWFE